MSAQAFRFDPLWFQSRVRSAFEPRKPRQRLLRFVLGLVGLSLLLVLVMFSVVIGAVMVAAGLLYRLWARRGKPIARHRSRDSRVVEGEYRVVAKSVPPR